MNKMNKNNIDLETLPAVPTQKKFLSVLYQGGYKFFI